MWRLKLHPLKQKLSKIIKYVRYYFLKQLYKEVFEKAITFVVVLGTIMRTIFALLIVTGTLRITRITMGFVWRELFMPEFFREI